MKMIKVIFLVGCMGGYITAVSPTTSTINQSNVLSKTPQYVINSTTLQVKSNGIIHNAQSLKINTQATQCNAVIYYKDKIYIAGQTFIEKNGKKQGAFLVTCYKKDEKLLYVLDDSFGFGGVVVTEIGNNAEAHSLAILPIAADNIKIVVGGSSSSGTDTNKKMFTLARYNLNGSLDTTFGDVNKGYVITAIGSSAEIKKIVVFENAQMKTNVIVAGGTVVFEKDKQNGVLVCYSLAGIVNTAWGQNGVANITIKEKESSTDKKNAWSECNDVMYFSDKLYVVGKVKVSSPTNQVENVGFVACFHAANGRKNEAFTHGNPYVDSLLWNSGVVLPSVGSSIDDTAFTVLYPVNDPTLDKMPVMYVSGFDKALSKQSVLLVRLGMNGLLLPTDSKSNTSRVENGCIATGISSNDSVFMNALCMYSYKASLDSFQNVLLAIGNDESSGFLLRYAVDASTKEWKVDKNSFGFKNNNGINVISETGMIEVNVKDSTYALQVKDCVVEDSNSGSIIVVGTAFKKDKIDTDTCGVLMFFHKTRGNPLLQ